jgi:hypothetical protein
MIAATLRQMAAPEATVKSEIHMALSPSSFCDQVRVMSTR